MRSTRVEWEWAGPSIHLLESVVEPQESTSESALWREFAQATTLEAFHRGWLAIQCRLIPGVGARAVFVAPTSGAKLVMTASGPEGRRPSGHLSELAERVLSERRGIALKREASDKTAASGHGVDVAHPVRRRSTAS